MSWSDLPVAGGDVLSSAALFNQFLRAIRERRQLLGLSAFSYSRIFPRTINPAAPPAGTNGQRAFAGSQNSATTNSSTGLLATVYQHNGSSWQIATNQTANVNRITVSSTTAEAQTGDYLTAPSTGWRVLQAAVEALVPSFANSADYPSGYDLQASIAVYTLATWRAAIGLNSAGFTRKLFRTINPASPPAGANGQRAFAGSQNSETTGSSTGLLKTIYQHNGSTWQVAGDQIAAVDVVTKYGAIQTGDIFGPWIANELFTGLNALRWTARSVSDYAPSGGGHSINSPLGHASWAAAKAFCEAAFPTAGYLPGNFAASTSGGRVNNLNTDYGAYLNTIEGAITVTVPDPGGMAFAVDFYPRFESFDFDPFFTFDATFLGVSNPAYQNKLWLGDTSPVGTALTRISRVFGDKTVQPAWCNEPHYPEATGYGRGAQISYSSNNALIRWDVPGGLVYVT